MSAAERPPETETEHRPRQNRRKWGLSPPDWRNHAVDERADHPIGVYRAQCCHLLLMVTALLEMPYGKRWQACAAASASENGSPHG